MLATAFSLVLRLPPLAFGPALPPPPAPPRALVCDLRELGRLRVPAPGALPARAGLDRRGLRPGASRHLLNPVADGLLVLGLLATTKGGWDDRTWSTKAWEALGAATPVLIPPQAPPIWNLGRR